MGGLLLWYSEERTGRGRSPPRSLLAVPNLTANLSTASVPITVLLYNDQWLCGFNVHECLECVDWNRAVMGHYLQHHDTCLDRRILRNLQLLVHCKLQV